jgi:hypothetical protein
MIYQLKRYHILIEILKHLLKFIENKGKKILWLKCFYENILKFIKKLLSLLTKAFGTVVTRYQELI